MHLQVEWKGEGFLFEGREESGVRVHMDGNKQEGPSPMGLLLHAVATCSAIDMLDILGKMQQTVTGLRVELKARRGEGEYPRVWEEIRLRFHLSGQVDPAKADRAMELSLNKYCSVGAMLKHDARITGEVVVEA